MNSKLMVNGDRSPKRHRTEPVWPMPRSKTLTRIQKRRYSRQVLECGSPVPLSFAANCTNALALLFARLFARRLVTDTSRC
jgi:hypothetical protein